MAVREITKLPDAVLRKQAHKVNDFGKNTQILIDDMIDTLHAAPGVGIAAPQVNESLRIIVVEYPLDDSKENAIPKTFVVVNPEITSMSEETVKGIEGCLSVPNLVGEVDRSVEVMVNGLNRHGKKQKIHAKGWLARVFQHETDHLNGILFVDRASKLFEPDEVEGSDNV